MLKYATILRMSESEAPRGVSKPATERALHRIIGTRDTDQQKFTRYQQVISRRQPEWWGSLRMLGDWHTRTARIAGAGINFAANNYAGGAMIYMASCEEHAESVDRRIPRVSQDDVRS